MGRIGGGLNRSVLPVIAWPVALFGQLLAFLFLYNTGINALQGGFESSRSVPRVKTLLVTLLLSSLIQVIPPFLFDATYHLGALWGFFMPAVMFVTPTKGKETIGEMICASVFAQVGDVLTSITPSIFQVSISANVRILLNRSGPARQPASHDRRRSSGSALVSL